MQEKKVVYHQCKEGDVLSRHIISLGNGVVLCNKGRVLTTETLAWLKNFRHSDIYIEQNEWNKVWHLEENHVRAYSQEKQKVKSILENFRFSDEIDYSVINEVSQQFFNTFNNDNSAIMGCVNIIRSVDEYTYTHSLNVGMLAVLIGKWLDLSIDQQNDLMMAGILHDIGKYRVPENILNKKGKLTDAEYLVMKKHVNYGYELIRRNPNVSELIKIGILCHHERNNGEGYPRQLINNEIHLYGKILAVADVYDAMISERVYKKRKTPFEVMGHMLTGEIERLDAKVLLTFIKNIANYYIGVEVILSTGDHGEVVFVPQHCIYRPIVKVKDTYIDLSQQPDIKIVDIK